MCRGVEMCSTHRRCSQDMILWITVCLQLDLCCSHRLTDIPTNIYLSSKFSVFPHIILLVRHSAIIILCLRDRLFLPQVLFFVVQEKGGGVEANENGKLVENPEENGLGGGLQT